MKTKSILKYPKGECGCVRYVNISGQLMFVLTTKNNTDSYFLYEVTENGLVKLGKGKNPYELEEKFDIRNKLCK